MLVNLIPRDDSVMLTAQPEFAIPGTSKYFTREKRKLLVLLIIVFNLEYKKLF